jgi:hypothetical protein
MSKFEFEEIIEDMVSESQFLDLSPFDYVSKHTFNYNHNELKNIVKKVEQKLILEKTLNKKEVA